MPARLMEPAYNEGDIVRKVGTTKAYVQFKGRAWPVGQAFFGEPGRHPAAWSGWAIWDFLWRAPDRRHRPGNEVRWRLCLRTGVGHVPELNTDPAMTALSGVSVGC